MPTCKCCGQHTQDHPDAAVEHRRSHAAVIDTGMGLDGLLEDLLTAAETAAPGRGRFTGLLTALSRQLSAAPALMDAGIDPVRLRRQLRSQSSVAAADVATRYEEDRLFERSLEASRIAARVRGANKPGIADLVAALLDMNAAHPGLELLQRPDSAPLTQPTGQPEHRPDAGGSLDEALSSVIASDAAEFVSTAPTVSAALHSPDLDDVARSITASAVASASTNCGDCDGVKSRIGSLEQTVSSLGDNLTLIELRANALDDQARGVGAAGARIGAAVEQANDRLASLDRRLEQLERTVERLEHDVARSRTHNKSGPEAITSREGDSRRATAREQDLDTSRNGKTQSSSTSTSATSSSTSAQNSGSASTRRSLLARTRWRRSVSRRWRNLNSRRRISLKRAKQWSQRRRERAKSRVIETLRTSEPPRAIDLHEASERSPRFYLALDDDIVDAPSIGPRTAERLYPAGIHTVRDLMTADLEAVAKAVNARHITVQTLTDWRDQSRLVMTIPWMRGTHAQLFVGAGFRDAQDIASADQADVQAALLRFCTTREGQRVLRDGPPPPTDKLETWIANASHAEPERAAA